MFDRLRVKLIRKRIAWLKSEIAFEEDQLEIVGESESIDRMREKLAGLEKGHDRLVHKIQIKSLEKLNLS